MQQGIIILAAGQGTRMQSKLPKVLHVIGGKAIIKHLLDLADDLHIKDKIIVYGFKGEQLKNVLFSHKINWVEQKKQLGTGHAVLQTLPYLQDNIIYLILLGDTPLIRKDTISKLLLAAENTGIAVLTMHLNNPCGYGRIIRDTDGNVKSIIEQKDANIEEQKIQEVSSGGFAIRGKLLKLLLPKINNDNVQREYYLTDIVSLANLSGYKVATTTVDNSEEVLGCNNRAQLAQLERIYQRYQAEKLMMMGITLADPNRIDIRGEISVGKDSFIDINCIFTGDVSMGENVIVEANCIIKNSVIGANTHIKSHTVIEDSIIGKNVNIGPFARIRPKTHLANHTKIGNFVETKNVQISQKSKINHLSYIGDTIVSENVNVGAGTITCNYDGNKKHQTVIKKGAFIGSNSSLIAPIIIGENVTIAAGSTITKDVESNSLAIARKRQENIKNWFKYNPKKK